MSCRQPLPHVCSPAPLWKDRGCQLLGPVDASRALGEVKQVQFLLQSLQSLPLPLALVMAECRGLLPALLQLWARPLLPAGGLPRVP